MSIFLTKGENIDNKAEGLPTGIKVTPAVKDMLLLQPVNSPYSRGTSEWQSKFRSHGSGPSQELMVKVILQPHMRDEKNVTLYLY